MKTAVIIARFQTPHLHEGHKQLITSIKKDHAKLIILLGIGPLPGSRKNPYDYYTREKMIKREYPDVVVLPVSDHPSDKAWSDSIDHLLKSVFSPEDFVLYGSRDSFIPYYSGRYETVELPAHGDYNATELRKQYADRVSDSEDFRAGVLYAYYNQYTKVYPTVDVAVFKDDYSQILLGKKANSSKWRLIGGFADPEDGSFEEAAARELAEECGDIKVGGMTYETSRRINDWRYRSEADKIITLLFSCEFESGTPEAKDDIVELAWIDFAALPQMMQNGLINDEHHPLLNALITTYLKN